MRALTYFDTLQQDITCIFTMHRDGGNNKVDGWITS